MARRVIGRERLVRGGEPRGGRTLDEVAMLVDWAELDGLVSSTPAPFKEEKGWPPLALFRALLVATWHDLSDVRLADALNDRASFRQFCGFAAHEPKPERTAFVRFRSELGAVAWAGRCLPPSRGSSAPAASRCKPER